MDSLKEQIQKIIDVEGDIFFAASLEEIEDFYYKLEDAGLIMFSVYGRETLSSDGYWLQAEYMCNRLGYSIIIDYDAITHYECIDDILKFIEGIHEKIAEIEERIR
jgi:hypothetical protein